MLGALATGCATHNGATETPVLAACARPSLVIGKDVPDDLRIALQSHISAIQNIKRFATVRASIRAEATSLERPLFIPPSLPPTSDAEKVVIVNDQACIVSGYRDYGEIVRTETAFKYDRESSVAPELVRECLRMALLCE